MRKAICLFRQGIGYTLIGAVMCFPIAMFIQIIYSEGWIKFLLMIGSGLLLVLVLWGIISLAQWLTRPC